MKRAPLSFLLLLLLCAVPALASDSQERYRSHRESKRVSHEAIRASHPEPNAIVTDVFTLVSSKSFADSYGYYVIVGEVRNTTASTLAFSKITFTFKNASGTVVGTDYEYPWGTMNGRLSSGLYIDLLRPNDIGFFKLWTLFKYADIASYTFTSQGDARTYEVPLANPDPLGPFTIAGLTASATIKNKGTAASYSTYVVMAGYQGGVINDVDYEVVDGVRSPCSSDSDSAIFPGSTAPVKVYFSRLLDSVGRYVVVFDECAASTDPAFDIVLNKYTYVVGDVVSTTAFNLRNPGTKSRPVEIKLFLVMPGGDVTNLASLGADGSISLSAGFNQPLGTITIMTISSSTAKGTYEFSSRIVDPASGKLIGENINAFVVQ
jgi:hypothetical protein